METKLLELSEKLEAMAPIVWQACQNQVWAKVITQGAATAVGLLLFLAGMALWRYRKRLPCSSYVEIDYRDSMEAISWTLWVSGVTVITVLGLLALYNGLSIDYNAIQACTNLVP